MKRHRHHAFTLIEIQVVIAIIAILIGLLLPAVQQCIDLTTYKSLASRACGEPEVP